MPISFPSWRRKGVLPDMGGNLTIGIGGRTCGECGGTGYVLYRHGQNGYEYAKPCRCVLLRETKERLAKSGLARGFQSKSFEDYDTYGDPQLEDAKQTALHYVENFDAIRDTGTNSLMLCGQVGAGKTHLGTACSMKLIDGGMPVIYMSYREAVGSLKIRVMDTSFYEWEMQKYKTAQVLFVDDFLKGKTTEADVNIVYAIVNHRYNNRLPFIISTEKNLDELVRFDEAIASRLIEMCRGHIVVFEGSELNYRLYRGGGV